MTTLTSALDYSSSSPAIIIPAVGLHLSYNDLNHHLVSLQISLAKIGVGPQLAVTISLINSLEFAISFLAVGAQRGIAAPLNPAYQQDEVEFYVDDIKAALLIVPQGAVKNESPAVRAARKFGLGIAEIWWDGKAIRLDLKEKGNRLKLNQNVVKAQIDDIAVSRSGAKIDGSLYCIPVEQRGVQKV